MTVSLIISTYNSPQMLELCLKSVLQQSVLPDEVLIADDGSKEDTKKIIHMFQQNAPMPINQVWHEDHGFRLTVIRNKAIAQARMDYIIQIDGDIILHRHFIKDHKQFAHRGSFVSGSRVNIQPELSKELLSTKRITIPIHSRGVHNKLNGLRCKLITRLMQNYKRSNIMYVRGCNMGFWKEDLIKVNGYNENMIGWGREDSEIACRLTFAGIQKRFIKNAAIAFHIFHPENSRSQDNINNQIMLQTFQEKRTWCDKGLNQYLTGKESE